MHPEIRHAIGMEGAAGLRQLVLMVRKHKVDAATMDVEALAEMLPGHRGAFDVPAGTAGHGDVSGRRPGRLARFRRLPQHEVRRIALVGGYVDAGAGDHLI
jgi:hypothetical protein